MIFFNFLNRFDNDGAFKYSMFKYSTEDEIIQKKCNTDYQSKSSFSVRKYTSETRDAAHFSM